MPTRRIKRRPVARQLTRATTMLNAASARSFQVLKAHQRTSVDFWSSLVDLTASHWEACIDLAAGTTNQYLTTVLSYLTLGGAVQKPTGYGVPRPGSDGSSDPDFDQRSEMAGPFLVDVASVPPKLAPVDPSKPQASPFPNDRVTVRVTDTGTWVSVVDMASIAKGLGDRDYPLGVGDTFARRAQRPEGQIQFGRGQIPAYLLSDPDLELDEFPPLSPFFPA
jgi:hypothetical protein